MLVHIFEVALFICKFKDGKWRRVRKTPWERRKWILEDKWGHSCFLSKIGRRRMKTHFRRRLIRKERHNAFARVGNLTTSLSWESSETAQPGASSSSSPSTQYVTDRIQLYQTPDSLWLHDPLEGRWTSVAFPAPYEELE